MCSTVFFKQHPTLCKARVETVPPSCMSLSAANGSSLEILGFIELSLTLGDITRRLDALVIPSLGPDQILLDNDVMSRFGAILDWRNQRLTFSSSTVTIPATHRSPEGGGAQLWAGGVWAAARSLGAGAGWEAEDRRRAWARKGYQRTHSTRQNRRGLT